LPGAGGGITGVMLPSFGDVLSAAQARIPFSNGTEFDAWSENWCARCRHEETCPLLDVVFIEEKTPGQWQDREPGSLGNQYTCTEFEAAS
jgi:hypothetical protein